jgi:hypothetical protein
MEAHFMVGDGNLTSSLSKTLVACIHC